MTFVTFDISNSDTIASVNDETMNRCAANMVRCPYLKQPDESNHEILAFRKEVGLLAAFRGHLRRRGRFSVIARPYH
jgi:hypothetical protein